MIWSSLDVYISLKAFYKEYVSNKVVIKIIIYKKFFKSQNSEKYN